MLLLQMLVHHQIFDSSFSCQSSAPTRAHASASRLSSTSIAHGKWARKGGGQASWGKLPLSSESRLMTPQQHRGPSLRKMQMLHQPPWILVVRRFRSVHGDGAIQGTHTHGQREDQAWGSNYTRTEALGRHALLSLSPWSGGRLSCCGDRGRHQGR